MEQALANALGRLEFYADMMPVMTMRSDYWDTIEGAITKKAILNGRKALDKAGAKYIPICTFQ